MKRDAARLKKAARVRRLFLRLRGARGIDEDELWQYALFFSSLKHPGYDAGQPSKQPARRVPCSAPT